MVSEDAIEQKRRSVMLRQRRELYASPELGQAMILHTVIEKAAHDEDRPEALATWFAELIGLSTSEMAVFNR